MFGGALAPVTDAEVHQGSGVVRHELEHPTVPLDRRLEASESKFEGREVEPELGPAGLEFESGLELAAGLLEATEFGEQRTLPIARPGRLARDLAEAIERLENLVGARTTLKVSNLLLEPRLGPRVAVVDGPIDLGEPFLVATDPTEDEDPEPADLERPVPGLRRRIEIGEPLVDPFPIEMDHPPLEESRGALRIGLEHLLEAQQGQIDLTAAVGRTPRAGKAAHSWVI